MYCRFSFIAIATCLLLACSGPSGKDKAVGSADINIKSDQARFGVLGPVKTLKLGNYEIHFDQTGRSDAMDPETEVSFERRTRSELTLHGMIFYTFDELGRIAEVSDDYFTGHYFYEGDKYYPSRMESTYLDDFDVEQSETHIYKYKEFDEFGNWLIRTDNGEKEVREITYYDVPKPVSSGKYKTPEAAIKASLKARQKGNLEAFLAAVVGPDASERDIEMAKYAFDNYQKGNRKISSFKVGKAEINESRHTADVHVSLVEEKDGQREAKNWVYLAVQGEDGCWYDGLMGKSE